MATDAAFLLEQPLCFVRVWEDFHRGVVSGRRLAGLAEHEEDDRFKVRLGKFLWRHRRPGGDRCGRDEMSFQPFRRTAGADLVEFRSEDTTDAVKFVAAAAAAVLEHLLAACQFGRRGIVGGLVALTAGSLNVLQRQHRRVPVGHVAVRVGSGRRTTLTTMADGATETFEGMLLVQRMVGERLRVTAVARVIHSKMARRAAIHSVEVGEQNLPDLYRRLFGQRPLLRRRGAVDFFLDEFALVILPLAVLVPVITNDDQDADQETEHSEPAVEFAHGEVVHISDPPLSPAMASTATPNPSSGRGTTCR